MSDEEMPASEAKLAKCRDSGSGKGGKRDRLERPSPGSPDGSGQDFRMRGRLAQNGRHKRSGWQPVGWLNTGLQGGWSGSLIMCLVVPDARDYTSSRLGDEESEARWKCLRHSSGRSIAAPRPTQNGP